MEVSYDAVNSHLKVILFLYFHGSSYMVPMIPSADIALEMKPVKCTVDFIIKEQQIFFLYDFFGAF